MVATAALELTFQFKTFVQHLELVPGSIPRRIEYHHNKELVHKTFK